MIEVIVFDLDDTLLDTSALLIPIAGTAAFETRIQAPLPLMPGAADNLAKLRQKYELYLLTQGHVPFQRQKIQSLGIEAFFRECFVFDPKQNLTKGHFFRKILQQTQKPPHHHLSIGNRRSTDLREAKLCGYQTCFFAHGEHVNDDVQVPEDRADFTVTNHSELLAQCQI